MEHLKKAKTVPDDEIHKLCAEVMEAVTEIEEAGDKDAMANATERFINVGKKMVIVGEECVKATKKLSDDGDERAELFDEKRV